MIRRRANVLHVDVPLKCPVSVLSPKSHLGIAHEQHSGNSCEDGVASFSHRLMNDHQKSTSWISFQNFHFDKYQNKFKLRPAFVHVNAYGASRKQALDYV
jgi:hypothetical protein